MSVSFCSSREYLKGQNCIRQRFHASRHVSYYGYHTTRAIDNSCDRASIDRNLSTLCFSNITVNRIKWKPGILINLGRMNFQNTYLNNNNNGAMVRLISVVIASNCTHQFCQGDVRERPNNEQVCLSVIVG